MRIVSYVRLTDCSFNLLGRRILPHTETQRTVGPVTDNRVPQYLERSFRSIEGRTRMTVMYHYSFAFVLPVVDP